MGTIVFEMGPALKGTAAVGGGAISSFKQEYKLRTTRIQKVTFLQESQTTKVPKVIP